MFSKEHQVGKKIRKKSSEERRYNQRCKRRSYENELCEAHIYGICIVLVGQTHHILPRSQGGSLTDESNLLDVCHACHDWIHANPEMAKKLGLLKSRYQDASNP